MYERRQNINSLFGLYNVTRAGYPVYVDNNVTDNSIQNYIAKETKVGNELLSTSKVMIYQEDPDGYKQLREDYAERLNNEFLRKWKNEYRNLINRGYTQSEAIKMTDRSLGKLKKEMYKDVDLYLPYF